MTFKPGLICVKLGLLALRYLFVESFKQMDNYINNISI
jgi:hypothetical protein